MKNQVRPLLILLLAIVFGCEKEHKVVGPESQYVHIRIDPNSLDTCVIALFPIINQSHEESRQLMTQNAWLTQALDKCLEKLEVERGLEPIRRKHGNFLKGDPNFPMPPEPWFKAYERPEVMGASSTPDSLRMLMALIAIRTVSMQQNVYIANDFIENFEERMQRLEKCIDESKDTNSMPVKQ